MTKMIRSFITLFVLLISQSSFAIDAKTVLDKTTEAYNKSGGVKIGFTASMQGNSYKGTILLSGKNFCCTSNGNTTWFDGTTMWTYVKDNEEVNVTNPTSAEISRMNPYTFLSLYKNGYKYSFGKNTKKYYEIVLTSTGKSGYSNIVVHIDKTSYHPTYVSLKTSKGTTSITVNSFAKNQKFSPNTFTFNKKEHPGVDVVDLR